MRVPNGNAHRRSKAVRTQARPAIFTLVVVAAVEGEEEEEGEEGELHCHLRLVVAVVVVQMMRTMKPAGLLGQTAAAHHRPLHQLRQPLLALLRSSLPLPRQQFCLRGRKCERS